MTPFRLSFKPPGLKKIPFCQAGLLIDTAVGGRGGTRGPFRSDGGTIAHPVRNQRVVSPPPFKNEAQLEAIWRSGHRGAPTVIPPGRMVWRGASRSSRASAHADA